IGSLISKYSVDLKLQFLGYDVSLPTALLLVFFVSRVFKLTRGISDVNRLPGMRIPFQPLAAPGALIPTSWWNPGLRFPWLWRYTFYKRYQNENVSMIPFISGIPGIYTSNLDVARQVAGGGHKSNFIKPQSASRALLLWGMNLVAADGDIWRKHRRIMGPAFNSKLYQMVWTETLETYREMILAENWESKDTIDVPVIQKLTFKLALLIIGKCGFGFSFNWTAPPTAPDGSLSVQEALRIVADTHMLAIAVPKWILALPFQKFKETRQAHDQLMKFMRGQVSERKADISNQDSAKGDKNDAFTLLVKANEDEESKLKLDDQELVYEDYNSLNKVLAVFYESLRMFPAGHILIREATEDTVLQIPNPPGQDGSTPFPVPKGTQVMVDMVGVQYNPRYFDEPEKYKPSRWYSISSRRFATTEAVAFLTMLLRDWRVEPMLKEGETKEAWQERVLDAHLVLTLGVADVPLRFTKRIRK
ncbi:hypothetical protein H0H87_012773, partial [Tephrocybe sp. NHM501043]